MCNELSDAIQDWMDSTIDPCDDFYQFTCGKFINESIIPPGSGSTPRFGSDPQQGKNTI